MIIPIALAVSLFICSVAAPATIYVPDSYATIQGAIDASSNGDTVIVRPGTYVENIDFMGKAITVRSEHGAMTTIIDGNQSGSVVTFTSGEGSGSVLDGFNLWNGTGTYYDNGWYSGYYGGGIFCFLSSPIITNNIITGNEPLSSPLGKGGGIACYESSPTIEYNSILGNTADRGGGIYCYYSSGIIADNIIRENTGWDGGGICCYYSSPVIESNTIDQNSYYGIFTIGASPDVMYNAITGHDFYGCGIYCTSGGSPTISENVIAGNKTGQYESGGGIYSDTFVTIDNNFIIGNSAYIYGGGIYLRGTSGTITNNKIFYNRVYEYNGGGIACKDADDVVISNNIISGNSAGGGGGIYCYFYSSAEVTNNTISNNWADFSGGGIDCDYGSAMTVTNSILWNNSSPRGKEINLGGNQYHSASVTISHSDVEGGQSSVYVESGCTLNWGTGIIDADPLFADAPSYDFHITWSSPCRDAGDNSSVTETGDFEGDPRIVATTVDIGADEYCFHTYHIGRIIPGSTIDIKVVGWPTAPVTLAFNDSIIDPPLSTQYGDLYLSWPPLWHGYVGKVPSDGILTLPVTVPAGLNPGDVGYLQSLIGPWGAPYTRLSNLLTLTGK